MCNTPTNPFVNRWLARPCIWNWRKPWTWKKEEDEEGRSVIHVLTSLLNSAARRKRRSRSVSYFSSWSVGRFFFIPLTYIFIVLYMSLLSLSLRWWWWRQSAVRIATNIFCTALSKLEKQRSQFGPASSSCPRPPLFLCSILISCVCVCVCVCVCCNMPCLSPFLLIGRVCELYRVRERERENRMMGMRRLLVTRRTNITRPKVAVRTS